MDEEIEDLTKEEISLIEFQDKVDSKFKKELTINNKSIYIDIRRSLEQILMEVVDTKEQFDFRHTYVIYCWSRRYCSKRS